MSNEQIFNCLQNYLNVVGINTNFLPLQASNARIKDNRIVVRFGQDLETTNFMLAHEIAHFNLHSGDLINNPDPELEAEADRAAEMIIKILRAGDYH